MSFVRFDVGIGLVLGLFVAAAYGPAFNLPFIGDDYVFLDETRAKTFAQLWSPTNVDFGWYRPWSRELHFWTLQHTSGLHPLVFRVAGALIWIAMLTSYAEVVRRLASARAATIAVLGVGSLALWGTPLLWISGSQDLWMCLLSMATLLCFMNGWYGWASIPFALALLSKETSAVLPAILVAYAVIVERRTLAAGFRRTAHLWTLLVVWLAFHPTIHHRLLEPTWRQTPEGETRPTQLGIVARTLLSAVNLDSRIAPIELDGTAFLRLVLSVGILVAGAAWLLRPTATTRPASCLPRTRVVGFAAVWMVAAWLPLLLPSIGWHAYYGCLGVLAAWLILATGLEPHGRRAVAIIAVLAVLQWARANTLTWDWGNEWYQRRAGRFLEWVRADLRRLHPAFPAYSRAYFGNIPNNIGFVAGQSPAIRIWYGDPTLQAGFYSYYRPRTASDHAGSDFFFHFDSTMGLVEVKTGPEDVAMGQATDPHWELNHQALAMRFLTSHDAPRAAVEFEKISLLPHRADAAGLAAVCWAVIGDTLHADSLERAAQIRMGLSNGQLRDWITRLASTFPG